MDKAPLGDRGISYLEGRKLTPDTAEHFGVGELSHPKRILHKLLDTWGRKRAIQSGLAKIADTHRGVELKFAWWDEALIFPFHDVDERIVYLQARRLSDPPPKYVNLKDIEKPLFNGRILATLKPLDTVYVCEGVMDVMAAYQLGMPAVGVLGSSGVRAKGVEWLRDLNVVLIRDKDAAGKKLESELRCLLRGQGRALQVTTPPFGEDLADYLQRKETKAHE